MHALWKDCRRRCFTIDLEDNSTLVLPSLVSRNARVIASVFNGDVANDQYGCEIVNAVNVVLITVNLLSFIVRCWARVLLTASVGGALSEDSRLLLAVTVALWLLARVMMGGCCCRAGRLPDLFAILDPHEPYWHVPALHNAV